MCYIIICFTLLFILKKKNEIKDFNIVVSNINSSFSSNVYSSSSKSNDTISSDNSNFVMKLRKYHHISRYLEPISNEMPNNLAIHMYKKR